MSMAAEPFTMSVDATVRSATGDDVDAVQSVAHDTWHETYRNILDEPTITAMLDEGYSDGVLRQLVDQEDVGLFVAEVDGDVVGYSSCATSETASLGDLDVYVHPDYWGDGIGAQLLDRSRRFLSDLGVSRVRDSVLAKNDVGTAFYERYFEHVDTDTVEIAGTDHEVNVYELDLD